MKKTRFFYGLNYFLIVLLGWLLLFGKAAEMNKRSEESAKREQKEKKKETDENKVQQREPSIRVLLTDSSWQPCYHQSVTIEQKGKEHTYTPDSLFCTFSSFFSVTFALSFFLMVSYLFRIGRKCCIQSWITSFCISL